MEKLEFVTCFPGVVDEIAKNRGVIRRNRMKQIDGAGVEGFGDFREGFIGPHLVVGVPILIGIAPKYRFVAEFLGLGKGLVGKFSCRRTEEGHGILKIVEHNGVSPILENIGAQPGFAYGKTSGGFTAFQILIGFAGRGKITSRPFPAEMQNRPPDELESPGSYFLKAYGFRADCQHRKTGRGRCFLRKTERKERQLVTYKLYLIRHGMTKANLEGRFIGRTDLPLCPEGIRELETMREEFEYPDVQKVYSSPMARCVETAEILYPNRLLQRVDALCEYDFGVFEGQLAKDLAGTEMFVRWNESGMSAAPEGAETITEFAERVAAGFQEILDDMMKNQITTAAAVLHGGVILNHPKRDPMMWMTSCGTGFTALINAQLWQRDGVFEVYSPIPFEKEPDYGSVDWDEEDDEQFFQDYPKEFVMLDVAEEEETEKKGTTPDTVVY